MFDDMLHEMLSTMDSIIDAMYRSQHARVGIPN